MHTIALTTAHDHQDSAMTPQLSEINPMKEVRDLIERNRTRPADEIADAVIERAKERARQRIFDEADEGEIRLRAERMGLTYAEPESPIFFEPIGGDERDWERSIQARRVDRYERRDITSRWWLSWALVLGGVALWFVLRGLGVQ